MSNIPPRLTSAVPDSPEEALLKSPLLRSWMTRRRNHRVVLAVSGGADSVALFRVFLWAAQSDREDGGLANPLLVAHINHGLRGEESDGDAAFVRELAGRFDIPYFEELLLSDELAEETRREGSAESAARNLRYSRLLTIAQENGARFILTAHHAEDQLETILQRIFRGTGIDGLTGIADVRPLNSAVVLGRPLLELRKRAILDYLTRLGQPFRTDSTNVSDAFTRNRIRGELVPLLESIFPNRWDSALFSLARQADGARTMIDEAVQRLEKETERVIGEKIKKTDPLEIPLAPFWATPDPSALAVGEFFRKIWIRLDWPLREMGFRQWSALAAMVLKQAPKTRDFPGGVHVRIEGDRLVLWRK